MLMPANMSASDKTSEFQLGFILRGGIPLLLNMLSTNNFLVMADIPTKRYGSALIFCFETHLITLLKFALSDRHT